MGSLPKLVVVASLALAAILALTAQPVSAVEGEIAPPRVEIAHWFTGPLERGETPFESRTLRLWIQSGECIGEPKPVVDHVALVERPVTAERPFKSALITVFVLFPEHRKVFTETSPDGSATYDICAGRGLTLFKRIKLRRDPAGLRLFDGSFSPPRRVWPRGRH